MSRTKPHLLAGQGRGQIDLYKIITQHSSYRSNGFETGLRQLDGLVDCGDKYFAIEHKYRKFDDNLTFRLEYSQLLFANKFLKNAHIPTLFVIREEDTNKLFVIWADIIYNNKIFTYSEICDGDEVGKFANVPKSEFTEISDTFSLDDYIRSTKPSYIYEPPDDKFGLLGDIFD